MGSTQRSERTGAWAAPAADAVGNYLGTRAIESKLINREYIDKTEEFYKKYGGKTGGCQPLAS